MSTTTINSPRYTAPAMLLHWLMGILILVVYFMGLSIDSFPVGPERIQIIGWHKWLGVTIGFLWLARVFWRATHQPPALPASSPAWQNHAAHCLHGALYLLMIAIPVVGWLMSSAKGFTVNFFGLFDLPNLLDKDKALGHDLKEVHEWLAHLLIFLVAGHVLAAFKHQFIDKDNLLARMRPARNSR